MLNEQDTYTSPIVSTHNTQSLHLSDDEPTIPTHQAQSQNDAQSFAELFETSPNLPRRIVIEYYKEFNPCTIVAESSNQQRTKGLVYTEGLTTSIQGSQDREVSLLDQVDQLYLRRRHVHDIPSDPAWSVPNHS